MTASDTLADSRVAMAGQQLYNRSLLNTMIACTWIIDSTVAKKLIRPSLCFLFHISKLYSVSHFISKPYFNDLWNYICLQSSMCVGMCVLMCVGVCVCWWWLCDFTGQVPPHQLSCCSCKHVCTLPFPTSRGCTEVDKVSSHTPLSNVYTCGCACVLCVCVCALLMCMSVCVLCVCVCVHMRVDVCTCVCVCGYI